MKNDFKLKSFVSHKIRVTLISFDLVIILLGIVAFVPLTFNTDVWNTQSFGISLTLFLILVVVANFVIYECLYKGFTELYYDYEKIDHVDRFLSTTRSVEVIPLNSTAEALENRSKRHVKFYARINENTDEIEITVISDDYENKLVDTISKIEFFNYYELVD